MSTIAAILIFFGAAIGLFGFARLIVETLEVSVLWTLAFLLFGPTILVYLAFHWRKSMNTFVLFIGGVMSFSYGLELVKSLDKLG